MSVNQEEKALIRTLEEVSAEHQKGINDAKVAQAELRVAQADAKVVQTELANSLTTLSAEKHALLAELNRYRWALRFVTVLIVGSGFVGLLKYHEVATAVQGYLDHRIAARAQKSDRLSLAVSMAQFGNLRPALAELYDVWSDMRAGTISFDSEYRNFFYELYISVLGQQNQLEPDGSWVGEEQWTELNKDPEFIRFLTEGNWETDTNTCNSLAFCVLKYGQSSDSLEVARRYFVKAFETSDPLMQRVPNLYALAMIDMIEKRDKEAIESVKQASELDPVDYRIEDLDPYKNTYMNSPEFSIWTEVCKRRTGATFTDIYIKFLAEVAQGRPKKKVSPGSTGLSHSMRSGSKITQKPHED